MDLNGGPIPAPDDDPLGPVVESFLARFRRGERPALSDLIARYPDLAGPIRELIPALVELEQVGGAGSSARAGAPSATAAAPPDRLGDYVLLRAVGGGGMGAVYEAEHESLRSRVALKVMHPRYRADPKFLKRFHAEARLAAGLHHTNIVGVFDYGEQDGICYYAMQFIDGQPLDRVLADIRCLRAEGTDPTGRDGSRPPPASVRGLLTGRYDAPTATAIGPTGADGPGGDDPDATRALPAGPAVDDAPSTPGSTSLGGSGERRYFREVARIAAQAADALDYAHRRGVLHRDIKPSNLLLDAMGNVWITDFGLAKLEEGDGLTQSHELVGTLRYMAPERLRGSSDRRGDVYSLGATLYELVTLRPPFRGTDQIRLMERIRDEPPPPPRELDRTVPRDLETIVLKAIAKAPEDRFASAGELADELRRFVEGRPIRSRPVSVAERLWRWCKRERRLAAACFAAAMLTIVLALGSTVAALVYRGQVARIRRAEAGTREHLLDALTAQARATRFSRRPGRRFEALGALAQAAGIARELGRPPADFDRLRDEAIACLTLTDLEPVGRAIALPPGVFQTAFDPSLTRYALRFHDGTTSVRRRVDGRAIALFPSRGDRDVFVFGFSPDGRYLATQDVPGHSVKVWDVDRRAVVLEDPGPVGSYGHAFRPDGRRIVLNRDATPLEYDLATGRIVRTWPVRADLVAFRPDWARLAIVDNGPNPPTCRILEPESGRLVRTIALRTAANRVAWSPDGRTLALACGREPKIDLWDAEANVRRATLEGHINGGLEAAFHPAGTPLVSTGWESQVRLWDPALGRPLLTLSGSTDLVFGRDGQIAVGLGDRFTEYRVDPALEYRVLAHASSEPMDYEIPSIHPGGRLLAVGAATGAAIWDLARGAELAFLPIGNAWHLRFEPSGDLLTGGDSGVQRWPVRLDADRGVLRIGPPRRLPLPTSRGAMGQDRSGRIVALAAKRYAAVAAPGRTFAVRPIDDNRYIAVSPDGRWLATGSHYRGAQIWRVDDGAKVADLPIEGVTAVAFSPDGRWLVAGHPRPRLWEVGTWRAETRLPDVGMVFSPDGRIMVVVEPTRILRLVDFAIGRTLARLEGPDLSSVSALTFSPDGARLVQTTNDGPSARVWDLRAIRKRLAGMGLDWAAPPYPEPDPADPDAPPIASVAVDYGALAVRLKLGPQDAGSRLRLCTGRIDADPDDAEAYHRRAIALLELGRASEAIVDLTRAIELLPYDSPTRSLRASAYRDGKRYDLAIADLDAAMKIEPYPSRMKGPLARECNHLAWEVALDPGAGRDLARALWLARRVVRLSPGDADALGAMGVLLYRSGRFAEAIAALDRGIAARGGRPVGHDLFILAMARHRLGRPAEARADLDRAVRWLGEQTALDAKPARELAALRDEAEALLAGPAVDLPVDVFAPAR